MSKKQQPQDEEVLQEDTAPVTDDGAVDPDAPEEDAAELRKLAEEAQAKADEYLAVAQRTKADFENYRRRNESAVSEARETGKADVVRLMLPVLDSLERAAATETAEDDPLKKGVELTLRQLTDALTKLEVAPVDRTGEPFDPRVENAVLQGTAEDGEPGTVCQVLQKGYTMGKNVLRAAMVKVVPED